MVVLSSIRDPQLIALLQRGAVGVIPTDTIYGLAACAAARQAVARLYGLKKREHKPGTLIGATIEQFMALGVNEAALHAVSHWWPNPISIVIDSTPESGYLHQGVGSLAVRIPRDEDLRALLAQTGPLVTSSVNYPGEPSATTIEEAKAYFGSQVDFYVDAGDLSDHLPSTVARFRQGNIELLRQGAVNIKEESGVV